MTRIPICTLSIMLAACAAQDSTDLDGVETEDALSTQSYNVYGAVNPGTVPLNGGLSHGYAYDAKLLGSSVKFAGTTFTIGAAGTLNAFSDETVAVTAGKYVSIHLLGTAINGAQLAQSFVVTYSDGTSSSFTQSMSDWKTFASYAGETRVEETASRITPTGATQTGPWNIYGYTFVLDHTKTVERVTLPANRDVVLFGISFTAPVASSPVEPPAAVKAGYSKLVLDSTFTSTSKIDLENSQAAGFDWYMTNPSWSSDVSPGSKFTIVNNAGTPALRIDGTGDGYSLYGALKGKSGSVGHQFTGGTYYEARLAMELPTSVPGAAHTNGSAAAWPAFWAIAGLGTGGQQWPGAPTGYYNSVEADIMEFMPETVTGAGTPVASFTAHDWYGIYNETCKGYCQTKNPTTGTPEAYSIWTRQSSSLKLQTNSTDATPTFHTFGALVVPSVRNASTGAYSQGYVQYYFDDVAQGDARQFVGPLPDTAATSNNFTPTATATWNYLGLQLDPYGLILSAGGNAFMEVEYVRVWQK